MPPRPCERVRRGRGRPLLQEEDEVKLKRAHLEVRDRVQIRTLVTKYRVNNDQSIIADRTLSIDLIVVKMTDVNVILGMN